ncbi:30S ribosomal protein S16 [Candidatus Saccharibacteria bacterium]|nr:30S ribosomal protein S16 [Candidatus Saccharibacteria bacterium]
MVVIRLSRVGRVKQAVYRIVAADKRRSATSKYLAVLGTFNPHTKEVKLNKELIETYLASGAQPSDRVIRILQAEGVATPDWAKPHDRFKKPKKEVEEAPKKEVAAEVASESADASEANEQSVDAPETAATEASVAENQKEATEKVAEAIEPAEVKPEEAKVAQPEAEPKAEAKLGKPAAK